MSLFISSVFTYDTDAGDYIQRVEGASGDNQALEPATRQAINNFVIGCKQDGIWSAIKASCILSGARTLNGALQPLVGTAPTNNGFIGLGTDYVRKTGLVGNGSSKYLDSNRNNNADPQNSHHQSVFISTTGAAGDMFLIGGGVTTAGSSALVKLSNNTLIVRNRNSSDGGPFGSALSTGLYGATRNNSATQAVRTNLTTISQVLVSQTPFNGNVFVFGTNNGSSVILPTNSRLAFYSIGESLDLALLDARVTALITAFGVAIP